MKNSSDATGLSGGNSRSSGSPLRNGNFGNGPQADLVVCVPTEDLVSSAGTAVVDAGAVIYETQNGLTSANSQFWFQGKDNIILSVPETGHQVLLDR